MKINRPTIEVFSLSFLDVISCGFGAIVLLLVLSLVLEPATLRRIEAELDGNIKQVEDERAKLITESQTLQSQLTEKRMTLEKIRKSLAQLEAELARTSEIAPTATAKVADQARREEQLKTTLQTLTEEMKRLLSEPVPVPVKLDATIGGVPVDSEYIVFIVDTSGSMIQLAWSAVIRKMEEVLSVHPNVKGLQVINDQGYYMFSAYSGRWIPDTPARRKEVLSRLHDWRAFSKSSPVEGIEHALRIYAKQATRISLYIFGDDFTGTSIDLVLQEVAKLNNEKLGGEPRVRIHTFGFPTLFTDPRYAKNRMRFAQLMRLMAEQNAGSFVGLTDLR